MLPDCDEWSKETIPAGFTLGCFFAPASLDVPNLLTPAWGMRVDADGLQPADGLLLRLGNASLQWFRRAEDPYVFILGAGRVPGMPPGHGVMAAIDGRTSKIAWKKDFNGPRPSGALVTASGLLFQTMPDGNLIASDAKTGEQVWQFQSGASGGGGPAVSYEIDGEQYIAVGVRNNVMAFKLGGPIDAKPQPEPAPRPAPTLFAGPIQDANRIEVVSYVRDSSQGGTRMYVDEYTFNVYRARVKVGHDGSLGEQRAHEPHDRGGGRLVDDRDAQSARSRRGHVRQARRVHLHLQGAPVGEGPDYRHAVV